MEKSEKNEIISHLEKKVKLADKNYKIAIKNKDVANAIFFYRNEKSTL